MDITDEKKKKTKNLKQKPKQKFTGINQQQKEMIELCNSCTTVGARRRACAVCMLKVL